MTDLEKVMEDSKDDQFLSAFHKVDEMEYPLEVSDIRMGRIGLESPLMGEIGDIVAIRPCSKEYDGKTFVGILLGDIPIHLMASYRPSTKVLSIFAKGNPAIFVPDLKKVIFGCESWWGKIKDENHLRKITDDDIKNTWYVQALMQIEKYHKKLTQEAADWDSGKKKPTDPGWKDIDPATGEPIPEPSND